MGNVEASLGGVLTESILKRLCRRVLETGVKLLGGDLAGLPFVSLIVVEGVSGSGSAPIQQTASATDVN